jgi:hypothetical protein
MDMLAGKWGLLIPLIAIQLALQIAATRSLLRAPGVRGGSKVAWGVVIWVFQALGPVAYFAAGRKSGVS